MLKRLQLCLLGLNLAGLTFPLFFWGGGLADFGCVAGIGGLQAGAFRVVPWFQEDSARLADGQIPALCLLVITRSRHCWGWPRINRCPQFRGILLNFPHEIKHKQNHEHEAQAAVQTVADAVAFGGNASDQNQQQDDEEDGGKSHDCGMVDGWKAHAGVWWPDLVACRNRAGLVFPVGS